jgi:predicted flap endonuclease-1-like 5' DNA nuclease
LKGLVDVAIDSDRRVVEDDGTGAYVVLDDDVRYEFVPEWTVGTDDKITPGDHDSDGFEANASAGDGADATASASARSDDGDSGGDAHPTAVVELSGPTAESGQENRNGERSSSGLMDRLQSAVESAVARPGSERTDAEVAEGSDDEPALTNLRHVGETRAATLREAGFRTVDDVRAATPAELREVGDIGATRAEQIRDSAAQVAEAADEPAPAEEPSSASGEDEQQRSDG